jgi:hypothetical protein
LAQQPILWRGLKAIGASRSTDVVIDLVNTKIIPGCFVNVQRTHPITQTLTQNYGSAAGAQHQFPGDPDIAPPIILTTENREVNGLT